MWNAGKKFRTLRDRKNKYYNTCCPKKNFGTKQKTITPSPTFKLNGRSLMVFCFVFGA